MAVALCVLIIIIRTPASSAMARRAPTVRVQTLTALRSSKLSYGARLVIAADSVPLKWSIKIFWLLSRLCPSRGTLRTTDCHCFGVLASTIASFTHRD